MAKLGPFFGPHDGQMRIFAGLFQVGSGTFTQFADYQVGFSGTYSFLGQNGAIILQLQLTDANPTSQSGPCSISINNQSDNAATYNVAGQQLSITTTLNSTPVTIYSSQNGTQINNISGHNAWIGP